MVLPLNPASFVLLYSQRLVTRTDLALQLEEEIIKRLRCKIKSGHVSNTEEIRDPRSGRKATKGCQFCTYWRRRFERNVYNG